MKMCHCFNCGKETGIHAYWEATDTCGARECEREARYARDAERAEAHEQLDRDLGY